MIGPNGAQSVPIAVPKMIGVANSFLFSVFLVIVQVRGLSLGDDLPFLKTSTISKACQAAISI